MGDGGLVFNGEGVSVLQAEECWSWMVVVMAVQQCEHT